MRGSASHTAPRGSTRATLPLGSDASRRDRAGRGRAAPAAEPAVRRCPAARAQIAQQRPGRLDLGARIEAGELGAAVDRVQAVAAQAPAGSAEPGYGSERRSRLAQALELFGERPAEGDLGDPVADLAGAARHALGEQRIDLHQEQIAGSTAL